MNNIPRSETNEFAQGMEQKDHILRLVRGAIFLNVSQEELLKGIKMYVDDETAIDRQPLFGWWNLGGAKQ